VFNTAFEGECNQKLQEFFTGLEVFVQIDLLRLCPSNEQVAHVVQQIGIESLVSHDLDSLLGLFGSFPEPMNLLCTTKVQKQVLLQLSRVKKSAIKTTKKGSMT